MKSLRLATLILMSLATMILQSCGNGNNTNGTLTISTPTVVGPTGGLYTISETITYTPPAGTVPNGVEVDVTINNPNNTPSATTQKQTLNSSGAFTITDTALQGADSVVYSVSATTGGLISSVSTILAGITPLNATPSPIVFASTDLAGTVKTSTIAGGISPYAVTGNSSADLIATIAGSTLSVTKTSLTGAVQKTATITVTDAAGSTIPIIVIYF